MSTNISPAGTKSSSSRFLTVLSPLWLSCLVEWRPGLSPANLRGIECQVQGRGRTSWSSLLALPGIWYLTVGGDEGSSFIGEVEPKISPETVGFCVMYSHHVNFSHKNVCFPFLLSSPPGLLPRWMFYLQCNLCREALGIMSLIGPVAGWSIVANEVNSRRSHAALWLMPARVVTRGGNLHWAFSSLVYILGTCN